MCQNIGNDAVRYSRTGDVFHYRWVALKCLDMLNPLSNIEKIVVENSQERMAGEYVIDVSEYLRAGEISIKYYQMKHTVKEKETPATISFFKNTLEGFAKRYLALRKEKIHKNVLFYVITNRSINSDLKDNICKKAKGKECPKNFDKYIKNYTSLDKLRLKDFCNRLILVDGCGDYEDLWFDLFVKTNQLLVGQSDKTAVDKLEIMVRDKAMPNSDGEITKEDVLKCLGYPSVDFLFPAPQLIEKTKNIVERKIYKDLTEKIAKQQKTIIHAAGGVGKSIFSQFFKQNVCGEAVVYDCFGLGTYALEITVDEEMKEWIRAADKFSDEDAADVSLLRRLMRESDSDMAVSLEKEKLIKRILILEEFQEKSMELLESYRKELKKEDKETIK